MTFRVVMADKRDDLVVAKKLVLMSAHNICTCLKLRSTIEKPFDETILAGIKGKELDLIPAVQ